MVREGPHLLEMQGVIYFALAIVMEMHQNACNIDTTDL